MPSELRYDPLYRVIDEVEELKKIEGYYRHAFDRLKNISNLGIIPRVLEMANYPKYEHSVGTVHQIHNLLELADNQSIPQKYHFPLRLGSIFLHTGHLPFTFSSERALLLACNLGERTKQNEVERYIRKRLENVFEAWDVDAGQEERITEKLLTLKTYKLLYRFLSADILIGCWGKIKSRLDAEENDIRIAIRNLVDQGNDGFQWLTLASKADYVQRDALYLGTVRIDISPRHLYGDLSEYSPQFSVNEEKLIEANLRYLKDRFYDDIDVVWFSRLYEKIIARFLISGKLEPNWLQDFNDSELERLIKDGVKPDGSTVRLSPKWTDRINDLFEGEFDYSEVFRLNNFLYPEDVIELEYDLIGKRHSQKGLLEYPFSEGILLSLDYVRDDSVSFGDEARVPVPPTHNAYEISLFKAKSSTQLLDSLKVIERLSDRASLRHNDELRQALSEELSWTGTARIDNNDVVVAIGKAIGLLEAEDDEYVDSLVKEIRKIKTYSGIWNNHENILWWFQTKGDGPDVADEVHDRYCRYVARGILSLPVRLMQFKEPQACLKQIYLKLKELCNSDDLDLEKGDVFEALCLIDRIIEQRGSFQFFINGMVVQDRDEPRHSRDKNEFDVVELAVVEEDGTEIVECWIYACSVSKSFERDNQDQLSRLVDETRLEFPGMRIRTRYMTPNSDYTPHVTDAGRNYN